MPSPESNAERQRRRTKVTPPNLTLGTTVDPPPPVTPPNLTLDSPPIPVPTPSPGTRAAEIERQRTGGAPGRGAAPLTPPPPSSPEPAPSPTIPQLDPSIDWAAVSDFVQFRKVVEERFPSWAWALDHPELGPLLIQAASEENWSEAVFDSRMRVTDWWNERTASQRTWDVAKETMGEADLAEAISDSVKLVSDTAGALGVSLTEEELNQIAINNNRNGWTPQELTGQLIQRGATGPGDITAQQTAIRGVASDYMIQLDEATIADLATRSLSGEINQNGVVGFIQNIAKQRFPAPQIVGQIEQGFTLKEIFQPHRQILGDAFGIDPNNIDLNDAKYRPVLGIRDGETIAPMTLGQVDQFKRTFDEFWRTSQGRAEKETLGRNILSRMGVVA